MFYFIVKKYKRCIVQNMIIIVVFFNLLLGLLFYANKELFELEYNKNIFVSFPIDSKYISDPFYSQKDSNCFMQEVEGSDLNHHVGYLCSYINLEKEHLENYVYINEYMMKFKYPMEYGEWIKNEEEIVVGGDLSSEYKLGDLFYIDSMYIGKVVGILGKEYSFMFLNVSGDKLSYKNIFSRLSENIVISNNKRLCDLLNMKISERAIMADEYGYKKLVSKGLNLKNHVDFNQMKSDEYEIREVHISVIMFGLLIFSIILNTFYLLYIHVCKSGNKLKIMWEQGYSNLELTACLVVPLIIDIIISYICVRIYSFNVLEKDIADNKLYGILMFSIIFSFVCVFILTKGIIKREVK